MCRGLSRGYDEKGKEGSQGSDQGGREHGDAEDFQKKS